MGGAVGLSFAELPSSDVATYTRYIAVGAGAEPGALRRALGQLAGVATVAGQVGTPVVEAVRKVMAAFGM